jgi:Flp pilus assembly pilin Flp
MPAALMKVSVTSHAFMRCLLGRLRRANENGATAVEYALIVGLIAAVIFSAVLALGQAVLGLFTAPLGGF